MRFAPFLLVLPLLAACSDDGNGHVPVAFDPDFVPVIQEYEVPAECGGAGSADLGPFRGGVGWRIWSRQARRYPDSAIASTWRIRL